MKKNAVEGSTLEFKQEAVRLGVKTERAAEKYDVVK